MTILQITVLIGLAAIVGRLRRGRQLALLAASGTAIFWLQPVEPLIRPRILASGGNAGGHRDGVGADVATRDARRGLRRGRRWQSSAPSSWVLRWAASLGLEWNSTLGAPRWEYIFAILAAAAAFVLLCNYWRSEARVLGSFFVLGLIAAFVVLKTPGIAASVESWLKAVRPPTDRGEPGAALAWLGFSYVAFRLLHTIRDRQIGQAARRHAGGIRELRLLLPGLHRGSDRSTPEICPGAQIAPAAAGSRLAGFRMANRDGGCSRNS